MVPKITSGGGSFKGAFRYYMHDKGADTRERIGWASCENMLTDDPDKAWKVMAFTAQEQARLKEASGQSRAGRKLEKPVFAFSLAWHPEQSPDAAHKLATARAAIAALGLSEHEAVIVAHRDEPQKHVHVIVNRVHPITGKAGDVRNSKLKLSDFALAYEREHGKIYCQQRAANQQQREQGKPARYHDPAIVEAWETTKTGPAFIAALEAKGYHLAQGRKRLVVIDPHGKAHNPTRHLQGVKAEDIHARLAAVDLSRLPDADAPVQEQQAVSPRDSESKAQDFETAAQAARESLHETHSQDYAQQEAQQTRRLVFAKKHLAKLYKLQERKKELLALRERLRQAPWWKRLLGMTRKDREKFESQARAYHKAVKQYRFKVEGVTRQGQQTLAELAATHGKERMKLEAALERQRTVSQEVCHERQQEGLSQVLTKIFSSQAQSNVLDDQRNAPEARMHLPQPSYPLRNQHGRSRDSSTTGRTGRGL